jgi:hypothetical protein
VAAEGDESSSAAVEDEAAKITDKMLNAQRIHLVLVSRFGFFTFFRAPCRGQN